MHAACEGPTESRFYVCGELRVLYKVVKQILLDKVRCVWTTMA